MGQHGHDYADARPWIHTHDDAAALIRYAALGARVRITPTRGSVVNQVSQASRRYEITIERLGRDPIRTSDVYSLPVLAEPIRARVIDLCDRAIKAAQEPWRPPT